MFAIGIGTTSLLTLFTPPLAHTSTALLIAVRVIEGFFEGVTYPCIHAVWARWAPGEERARLATLAFSGSYAGTVVAMPLCSLLAHYTGWPGIFYVFGILGLIWTTVWWIVVKESPEKDPRISAAELKYIQETRGTTLTDGAKHPWKAMLTSGPVWAIVVAHFSENWGFYTLLTFLPTFMKDVYKFETSATGWLSAIPYLAMAVTLQGAGHLADCLLRRGLLSRTNIRKLFNCGAFLSQTVFMIAAAYSTSVVGCVVCLTIAVGLGGFAWSGFRRRSNGASCSSYRARYICSAPSCTTYSARPSCSPGCCTTSPTPASTRTAPPSPRPADTTTGPWTTTRKCKNYFN